MTKIEKTVPRVRTCSIPRDVATRLLATSLKLSGSSRRRMEGALESKVEVETTDPKGIQEKYCAKLRTLNLKQLGKQLKQAAQRIKNVTRVLKTTDEHSKVFRQLQQEYTIQIYRHGWVEQEIARRTEKKVRPPEKPAFVYPPEEVEAIRKATVEEVRINDSPSSQGY